ncbi:hypothetical protein QFZ98_002404 [Paraburkholderia youngii]
MAVEPLLSFALQQRAAAFEVAQIDVVAQRGAQHLAPAVDRQHDFGLGIVPLRSGMQTDIRTGAQSGQHGCLRKDLRIGTDPHLEILRPHALRDQQRFEFARLGRIRANAGKAVTYQRLNLCANLRSARRIAFGLLFDHALDQTARKRDARRLDDLQVTRCEQMRVGVVRVGGCVCQHRLETADPTAGCTTYRGHRVVVFQQAAHGRRHVGNVEHAVGAQYDYRRAAGRRAGRRQPRASDERTREPVVGKRVRGV